MQNISSNKGRQGNGPEQRMRRPRRHTPGQSSSLLAGKERKHGFRAPEDANSAFLRARSSWAGNGNAFACTARRIVASLLPARVGADRIYDLTHLLPHRDAPAGHCAPLPRRGRGAGGEGIHGIPKPYLPHILTCSVCPRTGSRTCATPPLRHSMMAPAAPPDPAGCRIRLAQRRSVHEPAWRRW